MLERITMHALRSLEMSGGVAWEGTLMLDGEPALLVENRGDGGCNHYLPPKGGDFGEARILTAALEREAAQVTGLAFEALDAVTCAMENGDTAERGAQTWNASRNAQH